MKMRWGRIRESDLHFVPLPTAVFCVACELISQNNTPCCLACGSKAVLSLSRVLGGSMRGQQSAHLITDSELDRLVRELLRTVPENVCEEGESVPATFSAFAPTRSHVRHSGRTGVSAEIEMFSTQLELEPAIHVIAERAQALTRATGAAVALRSGSEIVCRARTGRTAPDIGVRLQTDSGISADCVRTGDVVLCQDAEANPMVDLVACRRLGVRSILAAPLRHIHRTFGVFEVLSASPYAFNDRDVATMQVLSNMVVAAMLRLSSLNAGQPAV
jgi:GAF domain-containing protein